MREGRRQSGKCLTFACKRKKKNLCYGITLDFNVVLIVKFHLMCNFCVYWVTVASPWCPSTSIFFLPQCYRLPRADNKHQWVSFTWKWRDSVVVVVSVWLSPPVISVFHRRRLGNACLPPRHLLGTSCRPAQQQTPDFYECLFIWRNRSGGGSRHARTHTLRHTRSQSKHRKNLPKQIKIQMDTKSLPIFPAPVGLRITDC